MTDIRREGDRWIGNNAEARYVAAMLNLRESGQLVASPYNQWGQTLPPSYSDIVSPEEAKQREVLHGERPLPDLW